MIKPAASQTEPPTAKPANQIEPDRVGWGEAKTRSTTKGDLPEVILDRYLIERDLRGRPERFYRDHRTVDPAFRDHGRRLSADRPYPDTVADMLKVAQHRGWKCLKVDGDEAFRREVWIHARAMGLDVKGYRPRDRDRQAAGQPAIRPPLEERLRMASAVVRSLIPDREAQRRLLDYVIISNARGKDRRNDEQTLPASSPTDRSVTMSQSRQKRSSARW